LTNEQVREVLREVEQPGVDGLAASAVDRLFRPIRGAHYAILDGFQDARKALWTVRDGYLELWTDEGWERAMTAGTRAGSELREITRRCRDGKAAKRAEGRHVNGNQTLPDGLRFDKQNGWSYDEAALAKVAKAYELLFEDRHSLSQIARLVGWGRGMHRTLANPTWRGYRAYPATADQESFEIKLPLEPLLSEAQWNRAQMLLAKRRTWSRETRHQRFLASGLLICACGRKFYNHCDRRPGRHDYYYCGSRHPRGNGCGAATLWREVVDAAVMQIIEERLTDAKFLTGVFRQIEQKPACDNAAKREAELSRLKAKRMRLLDALEDGLIDKAEFSIRAERIQTAMRKVEALMPAVSPPPFEARAVVAGLVRSLAFFRKWPFTKQRATLKRVVRSLPVTDDTFTEVAVSGAFLGELACTKFAQPLKSRRLRRCPAQA
jgi:DNA invertase Pin-like site-specific DNA recombinase